ncbi:GLTP domain-containing protein [Aspergillus saccharolyticus JOP 1030-1]|uniref:Glycolipid transfer protein n=1 Tax=Aspergillus saccharolyticus JOP 1030-1 TaxID=1450539 RepID=A0A318ZQ67_9EURO|nr:glycolipid transfer protein [Aspergillus saccharolyticus JOP 1030-1]PYH48684.1 glycolipid transfer protein [Aspergillus saccharolyticus JOP 1030-1]
MATWFDGIKSFADVPITANGISTQEFLEAAESLTTLFDVMQSKAFGVVKSDLTGNIKKVRDRFVAAPAESQTLQELVINELKTGKHTATEGLLWLVRGLEFTAKGLRHNIDNPSTELADSFRNAYGDTLKPHHSFVVKPLFSAAMSACPYRKDFYARLGEDQGKVQDGLNREVPALEERVRILKEFLSSPQAKW